MLGALLFPLVGPPVGALMVMAYGGTATTVDLRILPAAIFMSWLLSFKPAAAAGLAYAVLAIGVSRAFRLTRLSSLVSGSIGSIAGFVGIWVAHPLARYSGTASTVADALLLLESLSGAVVALVATRIAPIGTAAPLTTRR